MNANANNTRVVLALKYEVHWVGVFADLRASMYHVYNSLGLCNSDKTRSHQDTAATAEGALDIGCKWNLQPGYIELQPDQQQDNAWDCHIFLVTAASAWLHGNDLPRQRDTDACRAWHARLC